MTREVAAKKEHAMASNFFGLKGVFAQHCGRLAAGSSATAVALVPFAGAGPALAVRPSAEPLSGSAPDPCPTTNFYSVSNALSTFVPDTAKEVRGQTGVTLNVTAEAGTEWSGTVGGSVEGDVSFIVASAKATVSASIS